MRARGRERWAKGGRWRKGGRGGGKGIWRGEAGCMGGGKGRLEVRRTES